MNKRIFTAKGFALIEILLAVTIISGVMIFIFGWTSKILLLTNNNLTTYKVLLMLDEGVDAVKSIRSNDWDDISALSDESTYGLSFSSNSWVLVASQEVSSDGLIREITFDDVYRDANDDISESGTLDPNTKKVTVTIIWQKDGQDEKQRSLEFYITNIF